MFVTLLLDVKPGTALARHSNMKLFDGTLQTLERALDVRMARHGTLSGNIANVDTPGLLAKEVDFDAAMGMTAAGTQGAIGLTATSAGHLAAPASQGGEAMPLDVVPGGGGQDGNTVDLDRTMASLAENALHYGASARTAAKKLAILRYVASDGNG